VTYEFRLLEETGLCVETENLRLKRPDLVLAMTLKLRLAGLLATFVCAIATAGSQFGTYQSAGQDSAQGKLPAKAQADDGFAIDDRFTPPKTYLRAQYLFQFYPRGNYVPPLHWRAEHELPPGLRLEDNGVLRGQPTRTGVYHFYVIVTDSANPQQSVRREFTVEVVEALIVAWKTPPHVSGSRIEGSVQVSNTTPEDIDLTFIVEAVAENGRATAIGYQHFLLQKGTNQMELPFGDNLPNGKYLVNVDAIGEVAQRDVIFRRRLQPPEALQVMIGP
jgi:Putative Ig domain